MQQGLPASRNYIVGSFGKPTVAATTKTFGDLEHKIWDWSVAELHLGFYCFCGGLQEIGEGPRSCWLTPLCAGSHGDAVEVLQGPQLLNCAWVGDICNSS